MTDSRNETAKSDDGRFKKGNPGKPKGARSKVTLAVEALLDGEAEALTRTAIDKALEGDMVALRLCLDRICPPRKGRLVEFDMPPIETAADLGAAFGAILEAMGNGTLTLEEAQTAASVLEAQRRVVETVELAARIDALEQNTGVR